MLAKGWRQERTARMQSCGRTGRRGKDRAGVSPDGGAHEAAWPQKRNQERQRRRKLGPELRRAASREAHRCREVGEPQREAWGAGPAWGCGAVLCRSGIRGQRGPQCTGQGVGTTPRAWRRGPPLHDPTWGARQHNRNPLPPCHEGRLQWQSTARSPTPRRGQHKQWTRTPTPATSR